MTQAETDTVDLGLISDAFAITGRGFIIIAPAPFEMSRAAPEITGRRVRFEAANGVFEGLVKGVERFMPATPIRAGESIGLLVDIDGIDSTTVTAASIGR